jgi:hypothetical protein
MNRSKGAPLFVLILLSVAIPFLNSGVARAEDQATVDKIVQMNKKAIDDYDTLEFDSAKKTLIDALLLGKKSGLDNHPIMARTYVHLGAVYITGFKERGKGLQSFARALEIDPTIRISKAMSSPELEDAFSEALKRVKPRPGVAAAPPPPADDTPPPPTAPPPPPPPVKKKRPVMEDPTAAAPPMQSETPYNGGAEEPDLPLHINALDCPTPDEVPPDKSVRLRCAAAANLNLAKVLLLYRLPNSEDFGSVDMVHTPKGWYEGKLPKKAVTGKSVQFYFEGQNVSGKAVVSNGRSDSPNLILIREEAAAKEAEAEQAESSGGKQAVDTEENPLDERDESQGPRLYLGKVDKSKIGLDTRYGNRTWWIGLGVGSGYGYAKGDGLETRQDLQMKYGFKGGGGWAGLGQLAPEIGYQITPNFALSLEGRNQYIPEAAKYSKFTAHGAQSVMLRVLFFTKQSRLRFFGGPEAGGGEGFRFVLYPQPDPKARDSDYKDTVRGGPYIAGLGGGLNYEMTHAVSFVTEINLLAGFPIFSAVADLNFALQLNIY